MVGVECHKSSSPEGKCYRKVLWSGSIFKGVGTIVDFNAHVLGLSGKKIHSGVKFKYDYYSYGEILYSVGYSILLLGYLAND